MNKKNITKASAIVYITAIAMLIMGCQNKAAKQQGNQTPEKNTWEMLFDGETLNGWKVNNQDFEHPENMPDFYVKDQMIVCNTMMNAGGGYLVTEKLYDNFILELDVKIDTSLNSGIQCRGQIWDTDTVTIYTSGNVEGTKHETNWKVGYVWGYQIEIDPSDRSWSGGLYEPGNRGWVVTLADKEEARQAFKPWDWNHFKIVMDGNRIQTWVNDIPVVDTTDNMSSSGFIGLQFHGAYNEQQQDKKSMFKNIKIKIL